eukprot:SAG31_NODE_10591_length_1120_cov_1.435847_1_plen_22_part_10
MHTSNWLIGIGRLGQHFETILK